MQMCGENMCHIIFNNNNCTAYSYYSYCTRSHSHWKRGQPCNWISMASPRLSFHCATEARLTVTRWLAKNGTTHTHKHTWNTTTEKKKMCKPRLRPRPRPRCCKTQLRLSPIAFANCEEPAKARDVPRSPVHSPRSPEQTWAQAQGMTMMKMTQ